MNVGDMVRSRFIKESCGIILAMNNDIIEVFWIKPPIVYIKNATAVARARIIEKRDYNTVIKLK